MKLRTLWVYLVTLLLTTSAGYTATFVEPVLFSQNDASGWALYAGTELDGTPSSAPTVEISGLTGPVTLADAGGGYYWGFLTNDDPSNIRGKTVNWQSGSQSYSSTIRSGIGGRTNWWSLDVIALSENITVRDGTTLSWTNTESALPLDRFQIRIKEIGAADWGLDYRFFHSESPTGEYELDLNSLGFFFQDGVEYQLRVEARRNDSFDSVSGDYTGWTGIINRSVSKAGYFHESSPVPEPSSMILFGFGLLGVSLAGRKKISGPDK
jgi:hypothetical protein